MAEQYKSLELGHYHITGLTIGGEETAIAVPELSLAFDLGRAPRPVVLADFVFLSHGHMDHAAGMGYYFSQRHFMGMSTGTVALPRELATPAKRLMQAWAGIEGKLSPHNVVGMAPGDELSIGGNRVVRAFATCHGTPSLGFTAVECRKKLKDEFFGRPGNELAQLKRKGVEITRRMDVPLITYLGDTWHEFNLPDWARRAELFITECTFYLPEHKDRARAGKHMHAEALANMLTDIHSPHIVLTHASRRSHPREARNALKSLLTPDQRKRIAFFR